MKRSRLAALLGACLVSATLALAPSSAGAWWIGQPRFEKQVVTEGDPDGPDLMAPQPTDTSESDNFNSIDEMGLVYILMEATLSAVGSL